jgi:Cu(I)/Ag(I) efflux system periplasmic protein CusF
MKKIVIASIIFISASIVFAQSAMGDMKGMDMAKKPAVGAQAAHAANGTIKKIDAKTGSVVISHGPVSSLNWPPMTMGFKVKDKDLLAKLIIDKKVDFGFVKEGDDYVVTSVK